MDKSTKPTIKINHNIGNPPALTQRSSSKASQQYFSSDLPSTSSQQPIPEIPLSELPQRALPVTPPPQYFTATPPSLISKPFTVNTPSIPQNSPTKIITAKPFNAFSNSPGRKDSLSVDEKRLEPTHLKFDSVITSQMSDSDVSQIHAHNLNLLPTSSLNVSQNKSQISNLNIHELVNSFPYENYSYEQMEDLVKQINSKQTVLKSGELRLLITNIVISFTASSLETFDKKPQDYKPGSPIYVLENLSGPLTHDKLNELTIMLLDKYINLLGRDTFQHIAEPNASQYKIKLINALETNVIGFLRNFKNKLVYNNNTLTRIYILTILCMKQNDQYLLLSPKVAGELLKVYGTQFNATCTLLKDCDRKLNADVGGLLKDYDNQSNATGDLAKDYGDQFNTTPPKNKATKTKNKKPSKDKKIDKSSFISSKNKTAEKATLRKEELSTITDLQTAIEKFGKPLTLNQEDSTLIVERLKEISQNQDSYEAFVALTNSFFLKYLPKINKNHDKLLQPIFILTNLVRYIDTKDLEKTTQPVIRKYLEILQNDCPMAITQNILTYLANFLNAHKNKLSNKILLESLNKLVEICMLNTTEKFNYLPGASEILIKFHNELQLYKPNDNKAI